jgi:hypothetical protein
MAEFFDLGNFPKNALLEGYVDKNVVTLSGSSGTGNITAAGLVKLATFATDLTTTANNFVAAHSAAYQALGVHVAALAGVLTFTTKVKQVSVSFANVSGNLAGAITAVFTPDFSRHRIFRLNVGCNSTISNAINAIDGAYFRFENKTDLNRVTLTGTSGTANVTAGGLTKLATFATDLSTTAGNFVTANAAAYLAKGIILTNSTATLIFTPIGNVVVNASIANVSGNLNGTITTNYTITFGSKFDIAGGTIAAQTVNGRDVLEGYYSRTEDKFLITDQKQNFS